MDTINALISTLFDMTRLEDPERIAAGNFGVVHRYIDKQTKQKIAVKTLKKGKLNDKHQGILYFFREVFNQIYGTHPAVVPLIGWNVFDSNNEPNLVIVMKYMENGTLEDLQKRHGIDDPIDPTTKTILMYGIAKAMKHLHKLKIIHRDLKSSNIFIDEKNYPYIADLGLAKIIPEDNLMSQQCGTPLYLAPEIFTTKEYSFAADVYSFSCIVYELIENHKVQFSRPIKTTYQIYNILKNGDHPVLRLANDEQKEFLEHIWCLSPNDRWSFAQIVDEIEKGKYWFPDTDEAQFKAYKTYLEKNEATLLFGSGGSKENKAIETLEDSKWGEILLSDDKSKINASFIHNVILAAQQDDKKAQELASMIYYIGHTVLKSPLLASYYSNQSDNQFLQMFSRQTSFPSKPNNCEIGEMYEGSGNYEDAVKYYQIAAETEKSLRAMWRWGHILIYHDIDCQIEEGIQLMQLAADNGESNACFELGKMYLTGEFVVIDIVKAIDYLKVASDNLHPDAPCLLGFAYSKVGDHENSRKFYSMAVEKFDDEEAKEALASLK